MKFFSSTVMMLSLTALRGVDAAPTKSDVQGDATATVVEQASEAGKYVKKVDVYLDETDGFVKGYEVTVSDGTTDTKQAIVGEVTTDAKELAPTTGCIAKITAYEDTSNQIAGFEIEDNSGTAADTGNTATLTAIGTGVDFGVATNGCMTSWSGNDIATDGALKAVQFESVDCANVKATGKDASASLTILDPNAELSGNVKEYYDATEADYCTRKFTTTSNKVTLAEDTGVFTITPTAEETLTVPVKATNTNPGANAKEDDVDWSVAIACGSSSTTITKPTGITK